MNDDPTVADSNSTAATLDDPQASNWRTALSLLTEREGAVLAFRHGAFGGARLTFAEVAQRLGISRQRAHQLHERAIVVLRQREETQGLAEKLAAMGAPMAMEVESVNVGTDADRRETPQHDSLSPAAGTGQNGITDASQPDIAPSKRDRAIALKRVSQADRDLAEAVEPCRALGHEALVAALESARTVIRIHLREMVSTSERPAAPTLPPRIAADPATMPPGRRGPGRLENVAETARRSALLERVRSGELTNGEAASELGIKVSAWAAWKSNHLKRSEAIVPVPSVRAAAAPTPLSTVRRGPGRPSDPVENARRAAVLARVESGDVSNSEAAAELGLTYAAWAGWKAYHGKRIGKRVKSVAPASTGSAAPAPENRGLVARLEGLERFGYEFRDRMRDLLRFVDGNAPA